MRIPSIKSAKMLAVIALHAFACTGSNAADPRATQLTYEPWAKVCIRGALCSVGTGARGKCHPSGGGFAVNIPESGDWSLFVALGARGLEGDISVQIDQGDRITIPAGPCYASGCIGKLDIDGQLVDRLKRSQRITIEATGTSHRKLSLSFPLAGFAQAFDGPGTEPKVIEEIVSSKEMKERLAKAEEDKPPPCEE
jgi:invasion protein IalB